VFIWVARPSALIEYVAELLLGFFAVVHFGASLAILLVQAMEDPRCTTILQ
jgi:hypothetical protein